MDIQDTEMSPRCMRDEILKQSFSIRLPDLAKGLNSDYKIPDIQRGVVWNASRCEVLWDSILRGIPIGAFSLRPTSDGCWWEIFDGQQRAQAVAMGYAKWPNSKDITENKNFLEQSLLWIDLKPKPDGVHERKFIFRVTTPSHPWGYKLSNNEKNNTPLSASEQYDAVKQLNGVWKNSGRKGARPLACELWPVDAGLPVPFSVLRQWVDDNWIKEEHLDFTRFIQYCRSEYSGVNWLRCFQNNLSEPESWGAVIEAIHQLSEYVVIALNAKNVPPDNLGLYFRRLNKQGIEPDDEEIRYSMLKAHIPDLKKLDSVAQRRTRAAWLADIAVRFWLSKQDGVLHNSVSAADIASFSNKEKAKAFSNFIEKKFKGLLETMESTLKGTDERGLLSWHFSELYRHGRSLVLYFLRELYEQPTNEHPEFIGLATTLLWFGSNIPKCAENLWNAQDVQSGLFRSIREGALLRVFEPKELKNWADNIIKPKLESDDWGNINESFQNPYIGQALERIWSGFKANGSGCSLLLFACRKFMEDYFGDYAAGSPEWREQNRPWDYDHILPQNWVAGKRVSGFSYLVRAFLGSIGNSAPIPFSLNREKNAEPPGEYPDGTKESADNLHVSLEKVKQFKRCSMLDKNKEESKHFILTTLDRIMEMLKDWYDTCQIGELLKFDLCQDPRRILFEKLRNKFDECADFKGGRSGVWFAAGSRQYKSLRFIDWARPWLACGVCGTIQVEPSGTPVPCLLGVASDGKTLEVGIRRHPDKEEMPGGAWWLNGYYKIIALDKADIDTIWNILIGFITGKVFTVEPSDNNKGA